MEQKCRYIKNFLPYLLLLFEIIQLSSSVSPDELNIPYVPYVVVENKNKNEFDFDKVQETIVKYLENRSQRQSYEEPEQSTTLYDYLRTSTSIPEIQRPIDTRSIDLHPLDFHSNHFQTDTTPTTYRGRLPHRYETTPMYNLTSISKSYDTYATKFYPAVTDLAMQETKFVPLKDSAYSAIQEIPMLGHLPKRGMNGPPFDFGSGGSMKCSLRSSRYVYDGDCKSKKPVVETVCADRCIKYEYNKMNKPFFAGSPQSSKFPKSIEIQRPVVALACKDGDVKKQKIKLYCKDGTIINNIIRIVNSCVCQEHREKVHAKKKSSRSTENLRKRMYNRRALPKVPNTFIRPYK